MISHPDFVHIPLPTEPSPFQLLPPETTKRLRGKRKGDDKQVTSLLNTDVIPLLEQRGLVAETSSINAKAWEGVVRLPECSGEWGSRSDRLSGMDNVEGRFRRMTIQCVHPALSLPKNLC